MNRRSFLSWLGLGVVSAVIPLPVQALITKSAPRLATLVVSPDGRGDSANIQAALDALPPEGGSIFVGEGTYLTDTTITLPDKPVKIVGAGRGRTLIEMHD